MTNYLINLLGNFCELFTILFFLKGRYKPRFSSIIFIPACLALVGFQFLNTNLFLSKSYLIVWGSCLFIFCTFLLYKISWVYQIVFTIFIYLIYAFSELIVGMLLSMLFNIDISCAQNNAILFAICTLTSKFLAYFFVLISRQKKLKEEPNISKKNFILIFSLPTASFLVMMLFLHFCYQTAERIFLIITLITNIVLAFANIAVFHIIEKQNELIETKEKLLFAEKHINSQVIHYEGLYKHQKELSMFIHDIKNTFVALLGLLREPSIEKAIQTIEKKLDWLNKNNNNLVNSGNPIMDAILQSKLHNAKEKGVEINISTKLTDFIKIDEVELAIVIGNALDNAIEATAKLSTQQNKSVSFFLISTEDRISISVINPVENNIDTNNLTTTKSNKEKHGYGIKSIKTIAKKHDGFTSFTCEEKKFTVNINLANHPI